MSIRGYKWVKRTEKIKCPACGGSTKWVFEQFRKGGKKWYWVKCKYCDCEGAMFESKAMAAEWWNDWDGDEINIWERYTDGED